MTYDLIEDFADQKVLISGGAGFIGSHLARNLVEAGAEVTLVDRLIPGHGGNLYNVADIQDRVQIDISDLRDEHSMCSLVRGKRYLFNLAGQRSHLDSMVDPYTDLDINTRAQLSILEACRKCNPDIKVVLAGTRQVYGKPEYLPVDEEHRLRPVDINGINKLAGERYHILYNTVYGIRACILRLTNTYGPRMRVKDARQTFLGIWIRSLVEGKPFVVYGDGRQVRDFNYVEDVVRALLMAAVDERANGLVFNLGADDPVSLLDLAGLLVKLNGNGEYHLVPFPPERKVIDVGDYYGNYALIRGVLGWEPRVRLQEGLAQTLTFYHEHGRHYWEAS